MHIKEIEKVISLSPFERYQYFLKRIADKEKLYTLTFPDGNYAISTIDNHNLFLVWSAEEFTLDLKNELDNYQSYGSFPNKLFQTIIHNTIKGRLGVRFYGIGQGFGMSSGVAEARSYKLSNGLKNASQAISNIKNTTSQALTPPSNLLRPNF